MDLFNILKNLTVEFDIKTAAAIFFGGGIGAIIKHYSTQKTTTNVLIDETPEQTIRRIAKDEMVDADLCVKVAKCESGLNPVAINANKDGSYDHGIFQINDKYHPEVSMSQAFDVEFATRFFCRAFKQGNLSWWNASKSCWNV